MLGDCHIHMVLDGVDWRASIARGVEDGFIRRALCCYQQLGYRYLRDGGDRWGVGLRARELAADYGIVYRTPLAPLHWQGHYGGFIGKTVASMEEFARAVEEHKAAGADFIKIMISGLMDFDRYGVLTEAPLPDARIRQMIHIVHENGMSVMAHCNGAQTIRSAAQAGVDSVEHGAYADAEALAAMAERQTVWVPTVSTIGNLLGKGRFSAYSVEKILEDVLQKLEAFDAMGGVVAPGTDAGAWSVPHGCHTEEAWLEKAGISRERQAAGVARIQEKF